MQSRLGAISSFATYSAPMAGLMFTFYYGKLKPTVLCGFFFFIGLIRLWFYGGGLYLYGRAVDFLYPYRYISVCPLKLKILS